MPQYRYTDRALRALVLARDDARLLGHGHIGTEHILLGLMEESLGSAAKVLSSTGITRDQVFERIKASVGRGLSETPRHIPFTPRTKKVVKLAHTEAAESGASHVGTEHLLVGLLREGNGLAIDVLKELRVDLSKLRQKAGSRRY
jgi:ATP-dependent Clp protease ATP-binding subunit ClpC